MNKHQIKTRLLKHFGTPTRETIKVIAWELGSIGLVLQMDHPNREDAGFIWLPYPPEGESIPEIALQYAAESGRHSGTYASTGLGKGEPALKLVIRTESEFASTVDYIDALVKRNPLPQVSAERSTNIIASPEIDPSLMPPTKPASPRRQAIPRAVQREVWQRDGGKCVECDSKERLCFDHIIPFSRGGSNTVRNLQLLCERCNLSKGNRI